MKNEKVRNAMTKINKWIFKHEIISSCIFALLMGIVIGGITVVLDWMLV